MTCDEAFSTTRSEASEIKNVYTDQTFDKVFWYLLGKHFFFVETPSLHLLARQVTSPQLTSIQKLLKLISQLWCKLCDTLATISFVFEGGDLLSSHFWTEYGIN